MRPISFLVLLGATLGFAGCDCNPPPPIVCAGDDECATDEQCVDGACRPRAGCTDDSECEEGEICSSTGVCMLETPDPDAGPPGSDAGPPPECTDDDGCTDGRCIDGACCAQANACADACCGEGQVCFADACVTPGAVCLRATDCGDGEYCEPTLGDPPGPPPGPECLSPPPSGRCLALPPECDGTPGPGEICTRDCVFQPSCAAAHPADPDVCILDPVETWRWGPVAREFSDDTDVWSTPVVGRVSDTNCDGNVDLLDPPNLVFVSGNTQRVAVGDGTFTGTCCHCGNDETGTRVRDGCRTGVLRVLDGRTGTELWSVQDAVPDGGGIAGVTPALGDVDHDGVMEIVVITYDGRMAIFEGDGTLKTISEELHDQFENGDSCTVDTDCPLSGTGGVRSDCQAGVCVPVAFGWGGGIALGDMEGDGRVEAAMGRTVFEISEDGTSITRRWVGTGGLGYFYSLSYFVDLDGDGDLELLAGRTAYQHEVDGSGAPIQLWHQAGIGDSPTAVADFDGNGTPEVVHVAGGNIRILDGATGETIAGPHAVSGDGSGGPPTVANFDDDPEPEIGVALQNFYSVHDVDLSTMSLTELWATPSHDLSSSVTGSTVFDFEGDGVAEVVYNDECFLWVYDGPTGLVRFATPTTSFTGTEASLVADVDGDGQAEMILMSNGADPRSPQGWDCDEAPWNAPGADGVRPAWVSPPDGLAYRGIAVFGDRSNSWVGTRPLWNQHSYSVTNVCSADDDACVPAMGHGAIPAAQRANWSLPWLNNFRQNVQAEGLFDAADAAVALEFDCNRAPPALVATVRNLGQAVLPEGVEVAFFTDVAGTETEIGRAMTSSPLFPGQGQELAVDLPGDVEITSANRGIVRIVIDPTMPAFQECFDDNNEAEAPLDGAQCIR